MKTALITGANKGIGHEVARQLAAKGFHVFVGARNAKAGRKAAEEIAKRCHARSATAPATHERSDAGRAALQVGGKATFLEMDVADKDSVTKAVREFSNSEDHLDVLVNNAGIVADGDEAILEISDELFRKTLETNTLGALRVTRAFVPLLRKTKAPRVINVSSGSGQLTGGADGWAPAYSISKTALNGVTSQVAAALPKFAVNAVCPGWVRTDMGGENASRSVEEGADTIVWLATEAPHELTGKFLRDRKEIPW
jgi:NAD(P)-dependent dehydrogenase (short-subunit alcohol dehydrogenase family)